MRNAHYAEKIAMIFAHVGGNLDLRGTTLFDLDLSSTSVAGELLLGGKKDYSSCVWGVKDGRADHLNLRNTRIGNLTDAIDAWPQEPSPTASEDPPTKNGPIELDGFAFAHLGGFEGET
jgi:hypothetical protein